VEIPEILESVFWVNPSFCGRSRNSGIGVFGSNRDCVEIPENLESVFWVNQRFCGRSRILDRWFRLVVPEILESVFLGQSEILW
jgi:hypothetical protein